MNMKGMNMKGMLAALVSAVSLASVAAGEKHPWTHLNFQNDPDDFRFAIVPDRSGGDYRGAFTNALRCVNLMHPDFVMSVGDLIEGFAGDANGFRRQQDELTNMVSRVRAPFFYVIGNHDINRPTEWAPNGKKISEQVWKEYFGDQTYHSFVYKNCLFLVLNTQDGREDAPHYQVGMLPKQYEWVRKTLAKHKDVRWTFFFMHHPIEWKRDSWQRLEKEVLSQRKYTVFAGDWHCYFHVKRNGRNYYILSVAGGVCGWYNNHKEPNAPTSPKVAGPEYGEMDHITWVTMTADGPEVVNLCLDGILPGDYLNRATSKDDFYITDEFQVEEPPDPKAEATRCRLRAEKAKSKGK